MDTFTTGTFTVDTDGEIEVDYLFDGGWFRGELAVFSLEGMETYEPGSTEFIKEAARRALTDSEQGRILVQDELEGAKFSADLAWERDFNLGQYQGVKAFNLTPGDKVALMLVQHSTVREIEKNPKKISEFGKLPIFSIPEANSPDYDSSDGYEVVDVDGNGAIAFEDVPIKQADRDYNDVIVNLPGLEGNLPSLSGNINAARDWRGRSILFDAGLNPLTDDDLVMHLEFNETKGKQAADTSPEGRNNPGKLGKGAKFRDGIVDLDGKNDLIEVKDSRDINTGTHAQRTISLWFKADNKNISDQKQIIYEEGGVDKKEDAGLNIYVENGRIYFGGWNENAWTGTYLSSDDIFSNTWHHVALVLDAEARVNSTQQNAFRAYLDGVRIGSGEGMQLGSHRDDIGIGGLNETTKFHNGEAKKNSQHSLGGSLDDLRIYNRALSPDEIAFLFNANSDPYSSRR